MELNEYNYYQDSPIKYRKFQIQPLSFEGVKQYTTRESYAHKYLTILSPQRLKEKEDKIEKNKIINLKSNTELINKQTEEECARSDSVSKQTESKINPPNLIIGPRLAHTALPTSNFTKLNVDTKSSFSSTTNNSNKSIDVYKSTFGTKNYFNLKGIKNMKRSQVQEEQTKFSKNYLLDFENLGKSLKEFHTSNKLGNSSSFKPVKSTGFKSYAIPHIDLSSPRTPNQQYLQARLKMTLFGRKTEGEENEKLRKIHNTIMTQETQENYPKLRNICSQGKVKTVDIPMRYNKIMGEKYNPLNFYHRHSKTLKGRNSHGAPYEH